MSKPKNKKILSSKDINLHNFKIHRINKNKSILYRCKYCHKATLRKFNNKFKKLSGHSPYCFAIKRQNSTIDLDFKNSLNLDSYKLKSNKKPKERTKDCDLVEINNQNNLKNHFMINYLNNYKSNNVNNFIIINKTSYNNPKFHKDLEIKEQENIINIKSSIDSCKLEKINNFIDLNKNLDNSMIDEKQNFFKSLIKVFNKQNNLNAHQEDLGNYFVNKKKIIDEGSISTVFLGEDKFQRTNVAVLQLEIGEYEKFFNETFILQRIHGKGNFPQLYATFQDENHYYLVENLMGPNLKVLYKICNKNFDYYTVVNIAIDLIKNIKVLHDLGFIHRDLKPDNLVYGNLCFENYESRNEIGIIDFSHSKIKYKSNGELKYSNKKVKFRGNYCFSSTNALNCNDINEKDDIISIFYILIYFMKGSLPWKIKKLKGERLSKKEIIEIRKEWPVEKLCYNIPNEFKNLAKKIIDIPKDEKIDYKYIMNELRKIKIKEDCYLTNNKDKFCWIGILKKYLEKSSEIDKIKGKEIKAMLDKYNINLKEYLLYLKQ